MKDLPNLNTDRSAEQVFCEYSPLPRLLHGGHILACNYSIARHVAGGCTGTAVIHRMMLSPCASAQIREHFQRMSEKDENESRCYSYYSRKPPPARHDCARLICFVPVAAKRRLLANLNAAQEFIEVCLRLIKQLRGRVTNHLEGTLRSTVVVAVIHN